MCALSEEDIYLHAILLSQVATITLDILPALESRVVQKVHARVFNYNSMWVLKAESARRYTTYKCFNFAEALGNHITTGTIGRRP